MSHQLTRRWLKPNFVAVLARVADIDGFTAQLSDPRLSFVRVFDVMVDIDTRSVIAIGFGTSSWS